MCLSSFVGGVLSVDWLKVCIHRSLAEESCRL